MLDPENQTQFSAEQPFFEQPVALPAEPVLEKEKVPFFRRRKTIVLLITGATAILLLVLFVISLIVERNRRFGLSPTVTVSPPPVSTKNELTQEVEKLRAELKAVDPAQQPLQPPAVDGTMRLDPKER